MDNRIYFPQHPVKPAGVPSSNRSQVKNDKTGQFQKILNDQLKIGLKFSQHARQRLQSRNINLSDEDLRQLENAVEKAREKGACESLILMGDLALVVSVKNHTVITAVDGDSIKENVFTNIDSAVIM